MTIHISAQKVGKCGNKSESRSNKQEGPPGGGSASYRDLKEWKLRIVMIRVAKMCLTVSKHWGNSEKKVQEDGNYKGVDIGNRQTCRQLWYTEAPIFQSLCDNLRQRFPTSEFLEETSCLSKSFWPFNSLERVTFGEKHEVGYLCAKSLAMKKQLRCFLNMSSVCRRKLKRLAFVIE